MTHLSPHTWIDGEWLYTTDLVVAATFYPANHEETLVHDDWKTANWEEWGEAQEYRIPRSAAREVYRVKEGEPFCAAVMVTQDLTAIVARPPMAGEFAAALHLHAAILCGGSADSLRRFAEWIEEDV